VNNTLKRIGSADAINWFSILSLFFASLPGVLVAANSSNSDRLADVFLARSISFIPIIALLGMVKKLLGSLGGGRPKPTLVILAFVVSPLVGHGVFESLLLIQNLSEPSFPWLRLSLRVAVSFAILFLAGLLVATARELSRQNYQMKEAAEGLLAIRTQAAERIAFRKSQLLEEVFAEVKLRLTSQNSPRATTESLKQLLSEVIRPLSYRLARESPGNNVSTNLLAGRRDQWSELFRATLGGNPIHPLKVAFLTLVIMGSYSLVSGDSRVASNFFAAYAGWVIASCVFRLLWAKLPAQVATGGRAVLFVLGIAAVTLVSIALVLYPSGSVPAPLFAAWLILNIFIFLAVGLVHCAIVTLRETSSSLAETLDELKREVISLNNGLRVMQKSMARVLHGTVQQEITLAIKRLQESSNLEEGRRVARESQERISKSLTQLTQPGIDTVNLSNSLRAFAELWEGSVAIVLNLGKSDLKIIGNRPSLSLVLDELAKEGCRNAIVHGSPAKIVITVSVDLDNRLVEIVIENDGKALEPGVENGLGSQIFDDLTMRWSRTQVGPLVRLEAKVPL
jgi:hypothetical protein